LIFYPDLLDIAGLWRGEWGILQQGEWGILQQGEWGILQQGEWGILQQGEWGILQQGEWGMLRQGEWVPVDPYDGSGQGLSCTVTLQPISFLFKMKLSV
jgi:hypothetical protein